MRLKPSFSVLDSPLFQVLLQTLEHDVFRFVYFVVLEQLVHFRERGHRQLLQLAIELS